jgi:tetratricopeptide (TPR) repeat protein
MAMKLDRIIGMAAAACLLAAGLGFAEPGETAEKAFRLRMQGKTDEALELLEEDIAANPSHAGSHYELSRVKFYLRDFDGTQAAIGKAVEIDPNNANYHYFAGLAAAYGVVDAAHHDDQDKMKEYGLRAISELEDALRIEPGLDQARCFLVQQLSVMGPELGLETPGAEEHVRFLEEKDPVMGAKARSNLIDDQQKKELWEKILAEHGESAVACYEVGSAFIDLNEIDRAADCIDKAIALEPDRYYILLRLATAYAMKDDWDKAQALAERYLGLDPPVPLQAYASGYLAQIHRHGGRQDLGTEFMAKALALDPHVWQTVMPPPEELFTSP